MLEAEGLFLPVCSQGGQQDSWGGECGGRGREGAGDQARPVVPHLVQKVRLGIGDRAECLILSPESDLPGSLAWFMDFLRRSDCRGEREHNPVLGVGGSKEEMGVLGFQGTLKLLGNVTFNLR